MQAFDVVLYIQQKTKIQIISRIMMMTNNEGLPPLTANFIKLKKAGFQKSVLCVAAERLSQRPEASTCTT